MNNLYELQQSTDENKCAAYAAIYLYLVKYDHEITPDGVGKTCLNINDDIIIDTKLAANVIELMHFIKNKLFSNYNNLDVEEIGKELYCKIKSNPELTHKCLHALERYYGENL